MLCVCVCVCVGGGGGGGGGSNTYWQIMTVVFRLIITDLQQSAKWCAGAIKLFITGS